MNFFVTPLSSPRDLQRGTGDFAPNNHNISHSLWRHYHSYFINEIRLFSLIHSVIYIAHFLENLIQSGLLAEMSFFRRD
jgi:hypothetical protein